MQVNTEKTELALKTASSEVALFVTNAENEVKALEDEYLTLVPNAKTKEGYAHCKEVRAKLMPIKSNLEGVRKTLKAPVLEMGRLIDSSIKPLGERVESLYKPFESAYRAVDEEKKLREQRRQETIQAGFDKFNDLLVTSAGSTSSVIQASIDELADFDLDPNVFMERTDEAAAKHGEVMEKLGDMLMQAIQNEEMQAKQKEIEARERALLEAEQKAENERIAKEQEKARIEAEKQAELDRIEREKELQAAREEAQKQAKIDAEIRHKQELELAEQKAIQQASNAAKAERLRIEQEQEQIRVEAEKREANKKHKAAIHNAILTELLTVGITEEQAKAVIKLAATHKAASMYIKY